MTLTIAGEVTVLTSLEYLILEYLMRNARQVVASSNCWTSSTGMGRGSQHHRGGW